MFYLPRLRFSMPDALRPATQAEIAETLSYALRYDDRRRVHQADEMMARIRAWQGFARNHHTEPKAALYLGFCRSVRIAMPGREGLQHAGGAARAPIYRLVHGLWQLRKGPEMLGSGGLKSSGFSAHLGSCRRSPSPRSAGALAMYEDSARILAMVLIRHRRYAVTAAPIHPWQGIG